MTTTPIMSHAFSVAVHAYEGVDGGGEMGWVERDNLSLRDRVLFLGSPASFAADAAQLGMDGGCVLFSFRRSVFKYSLLDGEARLLMRQRPGWSIDRTCVWLRPQPTVGPIQQIRERLARLTIQEQENYYI
ncbi:hypothetical protein D1007_56904 [Hordeum vulgare]|nr:hypothetical protein D1007_56904 [Hordeum vulgare]